MQSIALAQWQLALAKSELKVANVLKRGKSTAMTRLNKARAAYSRAISGRPATPVYEPDLITRIAGIPCGIVITHYSPARCNNWGHPDNRLPDDPAEVEFFVIDRKGCRAPWLERMANMPAIEAQAEHHMRNQNDC